jgi:hypothetical protein
MTKIENKTASSAVKEILLSSPDGLREVIRAVMQEVLEAEMEEALGASKGERTPDRLGYRSGYYGRTLVTRVGKLELRVPQDRAGRFSTELFERYQRSERALVATLAEMYVQGVSTRKVRAITEELCGHAFSASSISAINKHLDESLKAFAERPLHEPFPYLVLDARYEKVREAGVVDPAPVIAFGQVFVAVALAHHAEQIAVFEGVQRLQALDLLQADDVGVGIGHGQGGQLHLVVGVGDHPRLFQHPELRLVLHGDHLQGAIAAQFVAIAGEIEPPKQVFGVEGRDAKGHMEYTVSGMRGDPTKPAAPVTPPLLLRQRAGGTNRPLPRCDRETFI